MHSGSEEVRTKMATIGSMLNLAPHRVGEKMMSLCGDIEVHQGEVHLKSHVQELIIFRIHAITC